MDAGTAKKLIEKNLSYDEVKRLAVELVQHASPHESMKGVRVILLDLSFF
jgi:hypothetical protein